MTLQDEYTMVANRTGATNTTLKLSPQRHEILQKVITASQEINESLRGTSNKISESLSQKFAKTVPNYGHTNLISLDYHEYTGLKHILQAVSTLEDAHHNAALLGNLPSQDVLKCISAHFTDDYERFFPPQFAA